VSVFTRTEEEKKEGYLEALTIKGLRDALDNLIESGVNPNNEILFYKDPEGNGLVTVDAFAGLVTVEAEKGFRYSATPVEGASPGLLTEKELQNPDGHVIFGALHDVDWSFG
jgi:hypothetical protein